MPTITYQPIGVISTPYPDPVGIPVQAAGAMEITGTIEFDPTYAAGLRDLGGFSHLILLYHLHLVQGVALEVIPFLDDQPHGIFATRSPKRPNPIGLAVVRLIGVTGTTVQIAGVDMVDGTPLLDIKPYVPAFDSHPAAQIGWFAKNVARVAEIKADDRFTAGE